MPKILLIQPSPYDHLRRPVKKRRLYFVGLALPLLAALTPDDWEVELCYETIEDIPFDTDATVIGISSMGHGIIRSMDIARQFRNLGKTVVMGGYMASLMPEEAKKHCDSVIVGDAEEVWSQVLADVANDCLQPIYKKTLTTLKTPLPRYDLILDKRIGDFLPVQAGRGCPNGCSFCSINCLYRGKYFQRDVAEVMRDVRHIKALGFKKLLLLDDNIYANPTYMGSLAKQIGELGMTWMSQCSISIGDNPELLKILAGSGCVALSFGLESITQESLNAMGKGWANPDDYPRLIANVRKAGIDVSTEMVVGADGDTLESIAATADFVQATGIVLPRFYILTPIPGTDFFTQMQEQGRVCNTDIYSYDGTEAVHVPQGMTPEELTQAYWDLYEKVYSIPRILGRTVVNTRVLKKPVRQIFYLVVSLFYRKQIRDRIAPNIF